MVVKVVLKQQWITKPFSEAGEKEDIGCIEGETFGFDEGGGKGRTGQQR